MKKHTRDFSAMGKIGGLSTSVAKRRAARANGRKSKGRPKTAGKANKRRYKTGRKI